MCSALDPGWGRVCVVAVQSSTYWRLNSFRFIRLIEPTHSKNSTFKCINLQWMIIRIPSSTSLPGLYNVFVLTVNNDLSVLVQQWLLFVWELSLLGILQVDATQIMYSAVVDWIIRAAPRESFFFLGLFSLLCLHPHRHKADAHDHQGDRPHGNLSRSQRRVAPWASSPFSLGEMPWLLSDLVLELRALSSCWDCLCNDDKGLWVIRVGLCTQSFNLSVSEHYPFVINVTLCTSFFHLAFD